VENERSYDMQEIVKVNINEATLQKLTLTGETSRELILSLLTLQKPTKKILL
jgi:flagellar assembly factor FliW